MAADATTSLADAMKKFSEALKALTDAWPGEKEDEATETPPPTDQAATTLAWARKKYDSLVRWVLACFSAIGLLIFGSVPFVDLTAVDMRWVILGLVLAGLGLGVVVWATTRALEPEDASLGEIKQTLTSTVTGSARRQRWRRTFYPPHKQAERLAQVLSGDEAAHFGPGISGGDPVANTSRLLDEIAAAETALLALETGWRLAPNPPDLAGTSANEVEAKLKAALRTVIAALAPDHGADAERIWRLSDGPSRTTAIKGLTGRERTAAVGAWHATVVAFVTSLFAPDPAELKAADASLKKAIEHLGEAKDALSAGGTPAPDDVTKAAEALEAATAAFEEGSLPARAAVRRVTDQRAILNNRLMHRDLLIAESGVSQLRGTFRLVRRWLFVGAVLTVTGGMIYAWAVANPAPSGLGMPITITMPDSAKTAEELAYCGSKAGWASTFAGTLVSVNDAGDPDGGFTAFAASGPCAGKIITVPKGEKLTSFIFGKPPAAVSTTPADPAPPSPQAQVLVTIEPEAEAWGEVAEVCDTDAPRSQPITLPGYVSVGEGPLTGKAPFDAAVICQEGAGAGTLVSISLAEDEGAFTAP